MLPTALDLPDSTMQAYYCKCVSQLVRHTQGFPYWTQNIWWNRTHYQSLLKAEAATYSGALILKVVGEHAAESSLIAMKDG